MFTADILERENLEKSIKSEVILFWFYIDWLISGLLQRQENA